MPITVLVKILLSLVTWYLLKVSQAKEINSRNLLEDWIAVIEDFVDKRFLQIISESWGPRPAEMLPSKWPSSVSCRRQTSLCLLSAHGLSWVERISPPLLLRALNRAKPIWYICSAHPRRARKMWVGKKWRVTIYSASPTSTEGLLGKRLSHWTHLLKSLWTTSVGSHLKQGRSAKIRWWLVKLIKVVISYV